MEFKNFKAYRFIKNNYEHIIACLAIVISIIALIYTCYNDSRINALTFNFNGIEKRPLLVFDEKIEKIEYELKVPIPVDWEKLPDEKRRTVSATILVNPELKVTNTGNSVAKVFAEIVIDDYTGLPKSGEKLIDFMEGQNVSVEYESDFFKTKLVLPNKGYTMKRKHIVNNINTKKKEFVIHYYIISVVSG
jgi:hypothetical protein